MKVFISYSQPDEVIGKELHRVLEDDGHDVWFDQNDLKGGDVWAARIENAIQQTEVFLMLLSPNVTRDPKYPRAELGFADKHDLKIVPVIIRPVKKYPEGFDLTLGVWQWIDVSKDHDDGIRRLRTLLQGEDEVLRRPPTFRKLAALKLERARVIAQEKQLGKKAAQLGGVLATGAAAAAVWISKGDAKARDAELGVYKSEVDDLLTRCIEEIGAATDMSSGEYMEESRPRIQGLIGQLRGTRPSGSALQLRHNEFVSDLEKFVSEFDNVMARRGRGDTDAAQHALQRMASALIDTAKAYQKLLQETG